MGQEKERLLFCFSGPAASGKSSICREVVKLVDEVELSVSTTTRAMRPGERKGRDYFFVTVEEFAARVQSGSFVEYAQFDSHYYGTEYRNVDLAVERHSDLILDIEVQGVSQLKQRYNTRVVVIFVIPPSLAELEKRLRGRGTESEEVVSSRLAIAAREIEILRSDTFSDYLLVNDSLEESVQTAVSIIEAERCRAVRNRQLIDEIISS